MLKWLYGSWCYAGLIAAAFLLALTPLVKDSWNSAVLLAFVQLPIYMIHQVEEHYRDRFRLFVNQHAAHGGNALTNGAVLVTNVGGVWALDLVALYLAFYVRPGLSLIAMYLPIVNGTVHLAGMVFLRSYNPGLISAVLLLLPVGIFGVWRVDRSGFATAADHIGGIAVAVAVHLAIVAYVGYRLRTAKA